MIVIGNFGLQWWLEVHHANISLTIKFFRKSKIEKPTKVGIRHLALTYPSKQRAN